MTAPTLRDSRRLTGPNLVSPGPAAVIDASPGDIDANDLVAEWNRHAGRILPAVGWHESRTWTRVYPDGVSIAFDAPIDALYAATEVNEWAFEAAVASLTDGPRPRLDTAVERLSDEIERERNPRLLALQAAAKKHGVCFTWDDDAASVGMGEGSRTWATDRLPRAEDVPWDDVHDIPVVLVTGSNGKTTTVRMLAHIARAWGRRPGYSCTDGVVVDQVLVDAGDWSGPGGARAVLRHPDVQVAILETARGGLLRRGLAIDRADGALVSNIAADHLGEWGVHGLSDIADAKLVVGRAVAGSPMVLNADDPVLRTAGAELDRDIQWMSIVDPHGSDVSWTMEDGWLGRRQEGAFAPLVSGADLPSAMGGGAAYNLYNALGACALATAMGIPAEAISGGLQTFGSRPEDNPGRGAAFTIDGVNVLVDFAHNPHGVRALGDWVRAQPRTGRVLTMVGQAGDRDDKSIADLARATAEWGVDLVVIKSMPEYARGRPAGEVEAVLESALREAGVRDQQMRREASELEAAVHLLDEARSGDLVVLPVHAQRDQVIAAVIQRADR